MVWHYFVITDTVVSLCSWKTSKKSNQRSEIMLPTFTKYETWVNTVSLNFSKPVSQHVYLRQEIKLVQDTQVTRCWYDSSPPPSCLFLYLLFTLQSQEEEEKSQQLDWRQTVCSMPAAPHHLSQWRCVKQACLDIQHHLYSTTDTADECLAGMHVGQVEGAHTRLAHI